VRWDFAGLTGFKKMLHGVWGRELPQDKRAKHTIRLWLCALTDWKEMRTYASVVQKLFRVDFLRWEKLLYYSCLLAPPYAVYSLYALLIINSIKHEGYTWLRHSQTIRLWLAPCLSGASSACIRAAILHNKVI